MGAPFRLAGDTICRCVFSRVGALSTEKTLGMSLELVERIETCDTPDVKLSMDHYGSIVREGIGLSPSALAEYDLLAYELEKTFGK